MKKWMALLFIPISVYAATPLHDKPKTTDEIIQNDLDLNDKVDRQKYRYETTVSTYTANQDNIALGIYDVLRLATDVSTRTITGLTGGKRGRWALLINVGAKDILFANESSSSTAVNRFITTTGNTVTIASNTAAFCYYDAVYQRWRLLYK